MAIASLILSIICFLISVSIFKDLALILGVISIVLGGIAISKKKSKVMAIIAIIIAALGLLLTFSSGESTEVSVDTPTQNTNTSNNKPAKEEIKNVGLNEAINVKNGGKDYTLTITGISKTTERNEFSDKNPGDVYIIDYTYTNNGEESLYIFDSNFKIIDSNGEIGDTYPNSVEKNPKEITNGITCKAQMCLSVNNASDNIKLQYFDNMFSDKPTAIFNLSI